MSSNRRTALVITRNLPPLVGGMERLIWHVIDQLREGYAVHVIGPRGCAAHLPAGVTATEVPIAPMVVYLTLTKLAAMKQAVRSRPHVVIAGSGLVAPFAWLAARLSRTRCIAYLHGLDVEAGHLVYRLIWRPFLRRCDQVLVNSRFTRELALKIGIQDSRIAILHPGVDLVDDSAAGQDRSAFRTRYKLGNVPVMLYVGRITTRKGLAIFVEHVLPRIIAAEPNAHLLVVGAEPTKAVLKSGGVQHRVAQALKHSGLEKHVMFLGERAQNDHEIDEAYFASDVLVFPVQYCPQDNEGFGMVAIEAAAHGLPTVAFAVGGVTDAVLESQTGTLVEAGDYAEFAKAVVAHLRSPREQRDRRSAAIRHAVAGFAWPRFGERLRKLCAELPTEEPR